MQSVLRPMIERQLRADKPYIRLGNLVVTALATLCAGKIPVVSPEDIAAVFGI